MWFTSSSSPGCLEMKGRGYRHRCSACGELPRPQGSASQDLELCVALARCQAWLVWGKPPAQALPCSPSATEMGFLLIPDDLRASAACAVTPGTL